MSHQIHSLMLGARGVGKTSMLAVMYEEVKKVLNPQVAVLQPSVPTVEYLVVALQQLRGMFRSNDELPAEGIEGSSEIRKLDFYLKTEASQTEPRVTFSFYDYPGGFWDQSLAFAHDQELDYFNNLVSNQADFFYIIIDTPALMENGGRFNELINKSMKMSMILDPHIRRRQNFPALFVALKCEKYVREGREEEVIQRIREEYSEIIDLSKSVGGFLPIACLAETTGNIVFKDFMIGTTATGKEYPIYQFKKSSPTARFSPKNCTVPLDLLVYYGLLESFRRTRENRPQWKVSLKNFLGFDSDILNAASELHSKLGNNDSALIKL